MAKTSRMAGAHNCDLMDTEPSGQRLGGGAGCACVCSKQWTQVPQYNEIINRLFSMCEAPSAFGEGWKLTRTPAGGSATSSDQNALDTQKDLHGPVKLATGQGFIRARPEEVLNMLIAIERRPDWDDLCDYASQVRRLGECSDIVYLSYQGKLGVCARDLCLLRSWQQTPDGSTVLVAHSIECEDVPRVAGKVRAECHDCAYMVSPAEDGCIFSYVIQLDMKGYVPLFFSNLIMTQHPLIISMLRRHLEDNNRAASAGGSCGGGGGAGATSGLARQADTHTHTHTHTGGRSNLAPNHMYPDT